MNKSLLLIMSLAITSCQPTTPRQIAESNMAKQLGYDAYGSEEMHQQYPTQRNFHYFRDPRTNLCFATFWGGDWHGGPSLATVDCSIPQMHDLLVDMP